MDRWDPFTALHGFSNGILRGPPPGRPARGSYVKQAIRKLPGRTKLPWYLTAPSASQSCLPVFDGLDAGTVFGPVHDVDETLEGGGHMSVLVPPPLSLVPPAYRVYFNDLVWL